MSHAEDMLRVQSFTPIFWNGTIVHQVPLTLELSSAHGFVNKYGVNPALLFLLCFLFKVSLCPLKRISVKTHQYGFWEDIIMLGIMVIQ